MRRRVTGRVEYFSRIRPIGPPGFFVSIYRALPGNPAHFFCLFNGAQNALLIKKLGEFIIMIHARPLSHIKDSWSDGVGWFLFIPMPLTRPPESRRDGTSCLLYVSTADTESSSSSGTASRVKGVLLLLLLHYSFQRKDLNPGDIIAVYDTG